LTLTRLGTAEATLEAPEATALPALLTPSTAESVVLQPDAASNAAHTDAEIILLIQTLLLPAITAAKQDGFERKRGAQFTG
jgi:hypothetical protein